MSATVPAALEARITDRPLMAHLATSADDRPHAAPVWYGYADGVFDVVTGGRKLRNVRRNPRVALSMQEDEAGDALWGATFLGTATLVHDAEQVRAGIYRAWSKYVGDDVADWPEEYRAEYESPERPLTRVTVLTVSYSTYE